MMAFSRSKMQLLLLFSTWLFPTLVSCGSLAAWWTDISPAILYQDDQTAGIRYSLCNSNNTPVLPADKTITLPLLKYPPKNGTSLAGTGWWDGKKTIASIFYQDQRDAIINTYMECDWNTGYWSPTGSYVTSDNAKSISSSTGLAAVLLGKEGGYRVFYHDNGGTLRQIGYTAASGKWVDLGEVSPDASSGNAIGATFSNDNNMTVVTPKNQENMEVSRWNTDQSWRITTFPRPLEGNLTTNGTNTTVPFALNTTVTPNFTLPAWDGSPGALGVAVNKNNTRSVFYIGTDRALYQTANINWEWRLYTRLNETYWPAADNPKAPLAVASNYGSSGLRVYYVVGGKVVEVSGDNGVWTPATALPSFNKSASVGTISPSASASIVPSASASSTADADAGGLSTGAKAGVGVGVSLGVLGIAGMIAAVLILRRRQRRRDAAEKESRAAMAHQHHHDTNSYTPKPGSGSYRDYPNGGSAYAGSEHPNSGYPTSRGTGTNDTMSQSGYEGGQGYWSTKSPVTVYPGELETPVAVHELPENRRPVHELVGEGHYREAP